MKKFTVLVIALLLTGCRQTSNPENMAGKIDMTKAVDYVVVDHENRERAVYILTGEEIDPIEYEDSDEGESPEEEEPPTETQEG